MKKRRSLGITLALLMALQNSAQPLTAFAQGEDPAETELPNPDTDIDEPVEPEELQTDDAVEEVPAAAAAEETEPVMPDMDGMNAYGSPIQAAVINKNGDLLCTMPLNLGITDVNAQGLMGADYEYVQASVDGTVIDEIREYDGNIYYTTPGSRQPWLLVPGTDVYLTFNDVEKTDDEEAEEPVKTTEDNGAAENNATAEKEENPPVQAPVKAPVKAPAKAPEAEKTEKHFLTVILYTEGLTKPDIETIEADKGSTVTYEIKDKAGYTAYFDEAGTELAEDKTFVLDADTDLVIYYKANVTPYKVVLKFDGKKEDITVEGQSGKTGELTDYHADEFEGYAVRYFAQKEITADGNTLIEVSYAKKPIVITFITDGGSFVDPVKTDIDGVIDVTAKTSEKNGYEFEGWKNEKGETVTTLSNLTHDVTLTADWSAKQVAYSIRYWKQKLDGNYIGMPENEKTYDFSGIETGHKAVTGTKPELSIKAADQGFKLNEAKSVSKEIAADGSTIIEVYYDRIECEVIYYKGSKNGRNTTEAHRESGLFGQPLTFWYPADGSINYWTNYDNSSSSHAIFLGTFDFATAGYGYETDRTTGKWTCKFYGTKDSNISGQITYYNEQADGSFVKQNSVPRGGGTLTIHEKFDAATYELYKKSTSEWTAFTQESYSAQTVAGFTNTKEADRDTSKYIAIFSKLKLYNVILNDSYGGKKTIATGIKATSPLNTVDALDNASMDRPSSLPKYYSFEGWYLDPAYTQKLNVNNEYMPNHDLILYAKWVPAEFEVTVDQDNGTPVSKVPVTGGDKVPGNYLEPPVKDGYDFVEWMLDENTPFDPDRAVDGNLVITAAWKAKTEFPVFVHHIYEDGRTVVEELGLCTKGMTVSAQAKTDGDWFVEDGERTKTLTVEPSDTANIITFNYCKQQTGYYQVQYVCGNDVIETGILQSVEHKERLTVTPENKFDYYDLKDRSSKVLEVKDLSHDQNKPTVVQFDLVKKQVAISITGGEWTYDQNEHKAVVNVTVPAGFAYEVSETVSATVPNESKTADTVANAVMDGLVVYKEGDGDKTDVLNNFELVENFNNAALTINKRKLSITTDSASKPYDGEPLKGKGKIEGLLDGDGTFEVTGSITEAGSAPNSYNFSFTTGKAGCYEMGNVNVGTLTITKADAEKIGLNFEGAVVNYNGANQKLAAATIDTTKPSSDKTVIEYSVDGKNWDTALPEYKDAGSYTILARAVNENYETANAEAVLKIEPSKLTLSYGSAEKFYDGTPLKADGEVKVEGDIFNNEVYDIAVAGEVLLPGDSTKVDITYKVKDGNKGNYTFIENEGTLTIKSRDKDEDKITVTLDAESDKVTYNGKEHSVYGIVQESFTTKVSDHEFKVTNEDIGATGTNAGEYPTRPYSDDYVTIGDGAGHDVTDQFAITVNPGKLVIEKRTDIEVTPDPEKDLEKVDGYIDTYKKVYDGEYSSIKAHAIDTKADNADVSDVMGFVYTVTDMNGNVLTEKSSIVPKYKEAGTYIYTAESTNPNYETKTLTAKLIIEKRTVAFTYNDESKLYDGTVLIADAAKLKQDGTIINNEISNIQVSGSVKLPGESEKVKISFDKAEGVDNNYNIEVNEGTLSIQSRDADKDKLEAKLTANSGEFTYDGTEKSVYGVKEHDVKAGPADYVFKVTKEDVGYKAVNAGTYKTTPYSESYIAIEDQDGNDVTNQFKIDVTMGTLIINKRSDIEVTPDPEKDLDAVEGQINSYTKEYDGVLSSVKAHAVDPNAEDADVSDVLAFEYTVFDENGKVLVENAKAAPAFKDAGVYEYHAVSTNPNYETVEMDAVLTITRRKATIESHSATKVYDGKALQHKEHTANHFVEGEEPEVIFHNEITNVETIENAISYTWDGVAIFNKDGQVVADEFSLFANSAVNPNNYEVTVTHGTLEVTKAAAEDLNLSITDKAVVYNGTEQTLDPAVVNPAYGDDVEVLYSEDGEVWDTVLPAFKDAGKYTVLVKIEHNNYIGAAAQAVLTIKKAELTVTTESAEKEYDGKALTAGGAIAGAVEGEDIKLVVTGTQTEPGTSKNTFEIDWNGVNPDNYTVTAVEGTLTVAEKKEEPKKETPVKELEKPKLVQTGSQTHAAFWASLMGAAGLGLAALSNESRKKNKKK